MCIRDSLLCSSNNKPSHCENNATVCECVHVINIPLHATVELILIDQGKCSNKIKGKVRLNYKYTWRKELKLQYYKKIFVPGGHSNTEHVFHLHGHSFYVVGAVPEVGALGVDKIRELDKNGQFLNRNLKNPIIKDTVSVPPLGLVALRFRADNPGKSLCGCACVCECVLFY